VSLFISTLLSWIVTCVLLVNIHRQRSYAAEFTLSAVKRAASTQLLGAAAGSDELQPTRYGLNVAIRP
jgi:hypothetical protein